MSRWVCLLKGVNVGGKHPVAMAPLRQLFESLGHRDVETYIQSGNVVFTPKGRATPSDLEKAVSKHAGFNVTVVVRTGDEFARAWQANPFSECERASLHLGFLQRAPEAALLTGLDPAAFSPERFALLGKDLYLYLPNGMARTKLLSSLDRALKVPTTVRNWKTVATLVDMTRS